MPLYTCCFLDFFFVWEQVPRSPVFKQSGFLGTVWWMSGPNDTKSTNFFHDAEVSHPKRTRFAFWMGNPSAISAKFRVVVGEILWFGQIESKREQTFLDCCFKNWAVSSSERFLSPSWLVNVEIHCAWSMIFVLIRYWRQTLLSATWQVGDTVEVEAGKRPVVGEICELFQEPSLTRFLESREIHKKYHTRWRRHFGSKHIMRQESKKIDTFHLKLLSNRLFWKVVWRRLFEGDGLTS